MAFSIFYLVPLLPWTVVVAAVAVPAEPVAAHQPLNDHPGRPSQ
eukprot:CAMPEP_0202380618 /NCGR_PEP_ID=MMETSP1127-20130417/29814_1 /ASSEMBLY_ACC=CAM_ASM_000462 /TAXON_ID=3047 /ORGANISM="Dunaliella tertiolecta, Strain CCMP1320" /LENGTH=43 /DNA_ID= /DNA_START= /DNA_END= /DNA_ORIENTATION=